MATEGWPPIKHVWTQAIIGLCFILMLFILIDLCRKFYLNSNPNKSPKRVVSTSSLGTSSKDSSTTSPTTTNTSNSSRPATTKKKPISKFYKITSITSVAAFTIAVLIDFGDGVHYFHTGIDVFHTKDYWAVVLTNVFFGISTVSLYIFMFGRLYLTFKASEKKYHLSKLTIYVVVSLIVLNGFAILFYTTCIGMIYDYIAIGTFYKYLDASFQFILICDFSLNFIILSLFLYKLQQIVLSLDFSTDYTQIDIRDASNEDDGDENHDGKSRKESVKLNDHQIKMVTIMTRHTILSSIAITFNILFYISIIHGSNIEVLDELDLWFLGYSNMIKALHGLSVAATLALNFNFNINTYHMLCNKCHLCCYNMFHKMAKKQIRKKNEEVMNTSSQELKISQIGDDD